MLEQFSMKGKVALVTGGSSGIGFMIASGLLKSGAKVYIASRKEDALAEAQKALSEHGECITIKADLSSEEGCIALADSLKSKEKALNILVNNAGATWGAPLESYPDKAWERIMGLNVRAMFNLTKFCLPLLESAASKEGPAKIINISSVASMSSGSMSAYAYGASKAAVNQLTKLLAMDLSGKSICVNAIAPGLFPSKMTDFMMPNEDAQTAIGKSIPLGRVGCLSDMEALGAFLAGPGSNYITGTVIPIDGGQLLKG